MSFKLRLALGSLAALAALQGCSSGSGGSDVGEHQATAPTARVEVLNGGTARAFREGAEVLLTGKASEDRDGPPIAWSFRQTFGPPVRPVPPCASGSGVKSSSASTRQPLAVSAGTPPANSAASTPQSALGVERGG